MIDPTPEQEAIFSAFPGPLRVAAGAGTGKTTTIALLVRWLVTSTDIEPAEILGITFTVKAATELSDRIRSLLQPGSNHEAEVATYHGFAAGIISEFGAAVGMEPEAKIIGRAQSRQLLYEVVRSRRFHHIDPTWRGVVDRLSSLAAAMGDHLVDPEAMRRLAMEEAPWPERLELLAAWEEYQERKRALAALDYGDLVATAVRIVEDYPEAVERLRSRHRVVLLDEYQDTNPAQRILLQSIFGGGRPVIAVGDVDQTIYEWRGATPANFVSFPRHFPRPDGEPALEKALTLNRRSDRLIVDVANAVRTLLDSHSQPLRPRPEAGSGRVSLRWLGDAVAEAEWVGDEVLRLHDEGVAWSEIAVLLRNNRHIPVFVEAFARRQIPVEVANLGGLLGVRQVADLRAWLCLLDDPTDDPALLRILMGPRYCLGMADLAALGDRRDSLLETVDGLELTGLSDRIGSALADFRAEYRELAVLAQAASVAELAREVLERTGAWSEVEAMVGAARLTARLNLHRFLDVTEEWTPLSGRPSLSAFLDYLVWLEEEPDGAGDAARLSGEEAVAVLTIHRAKGLEWDAVFLPAVAAGSFPARSQGYDDPDARAHALPYQLRRDGLPPPTKDELRRRHVISEWRLAYVAVTRARRRLYLTGAHWYGFPEPNKQPVGPSEIFELVGEVPGVEHLGVDPVGERPEALPALPTAPAPDPLFASGWGAALRTARADADYPLRLADERGVGEATRRLIDDGRRQLASLEAPSARGATLPPATSVTGLVTYAFCPQRFYWSEIDRLPRRPSAAARRGSDVHRRIEAHLKGVLAFSEPDDLPAADDRTGPGVDPFRTFLASPYARRRPLLVESPFQYPTAAGIGVRGRLDAVYDTEDGGWEIVDFKTGPRRDGRERLLQLQAYALAAERVEWGLVPPRSVRVTFAHLGRGLETETHLVDGEWLQRAKQRVEQVTAAIAARRFDPAPSPACRHCDFSRFCEPGRRWLGADREGNGG